MMGTTFPTERLPINDGANLFRDAKKVLLNADVAMGNLEGPLCVFGETTKEGENSYAFRTPPSYARRLKEAGFDYAACGFSQAYSSGKDGNRRQF